MKNQTVSPNFDNLVQYEDLLAMTNEVNSNSANGSVFSFLRNNHKSLPNVLFITSYPPTDCGNTTYTQDLMNAIKNKFGKSFSLKVCALQEKDTELSYPDEVKYVLNTNKLEQYDLLAQNINSDTKLDIVFIQHEFGLYGGNYGDYLLQLLGEINKTVITAFHTVLPNPNPELLTVVQSIATLSNGLVVMTQNAADILMKEYDVPAEKIIVIAHGTHLIYFRDCTDKLGITELMAKQTEFELVQS